jgi:hypothetical protein
MKTPKLEKGGRALWRWIHERFDVSGCEPMVEELAVLRDRLDSLRADIAVRGVVLENGRKNPTVDLELKASAAYTRIWRCLGLDEESANETKGGR